MWLADPPTIARLQPDSGSYLDGASIRGAIYPALLRFFGVEAIAFVQLALYFLAAALAARAIARTFESTLASVAYLAFVGANPELVKHCFTVLSEAPSLAAAMLFLAAAARAAEGRASGFVAMGILAAIAIDLRVVNWSWVPLLPLTALLARAGWRAPLAGLVAFAVPMVAVSLARAPSADADQREFLALNLFGKFALLVDSPEGAFEQAVARETRDMRARLDAMDDFGVAFGLRAVYAEHLRYGVWRDFAAQAGPDPLAAVVDLAIARPGAYALEIARQLRGFWTMPDLIDAGERAARDAALAALPTRLCARSKPCPRRARRRSFGVFARCCRSRRSLRPRSGAPPSLSRASPRWRCGATGPWWRRCTRPCRATRSARGRFWAFVWPPLSPQYAVFDDRVDGPERVLQTDFLAPGRRSLRHRKCRLRRRRDFSARACR
jgi:hypothetical protein